MKPKNPLCVLILTREGVSGCWPALPSGLGSHRQREEQREHSGAGMDIAKLSGSVVGKALCFGSCRGVLEVWRPPCAERKPCQHLAALSIHLQTWNPSLFHKGECKIFSIYPFWTTFCCWSRQKCFVEVYNSSQPKCFFWIQRANYLFKMPFQNCLQASPPLKLNPNLSLMYL